MGLPERWPPTYRQRTYCAVYTSSVLRTPEHCIRLLARIRSITAVCCTWYTVYIINTYVRVCTSRCYFYFSTHPTDVLFLTLQKRVIDRSTQPLRACGADPSIASMCTNIRKHTAVAKYVALPASYVRRLPLCDCGVDMHLVLAKNEGRVCFRT